MLQIAQNLQSVNNLQETQRTQNISHFNQLKCFVYGLATSFRTKTRVLLSYNCKYKES